MKKFNLLAKSLYTLTFVAAVNAPIVSATQTSLTVNAQALINVSLQENLNLIESALHIGLEKEMVMAVRNNQSLVVELASSQPIKDDKIISSVSE